MEILASFFIREASEKRFNFLQGIFVSDASVFETQLASIALSACEYRKRNHFRSPDTYRIISLPISFGILKERLNLPAEGSYCIVSSATLLRKLYERGKFIVFREDCFIYEHLW